MNNNTFNSGKIFFCKKCVFPSTKPHIEFNEDGVCTGCLAYLNRKEIDWDERQKKLLEIIQKYKKKMRDIIIVLFHQVEVKTAIIKQLKL